MQFLGDERVREFVEFVDQRGRTTAVGQIAQLQRVRHAVVELVFEFGSGAVDPVGRGVAGEQGRW
ncbi:hypothetical protein [Nocardia sp. CC227C]|uniref:hypothetical protein n=1 Tax=Nocardia sp. CC227C TaxID=3044562 RepID=UPI00278BBFDD|nr:hypothetical protein [Nocardia sp. CC227C]